MESVICFSSPETYVVGARTLPNRLIFSYDTERWDFRALVARYFGTNDLEQLHLLPEFNPRTSCDSAPNYEVTRNSWAISKALKAAVAPESTPLFRSLLYEHVAEFLYPVSGFQAQPATRVNFHGGKAILLFHRDSEYGQTNEGINLWLPVTKVSGTNSMYVESDVGSADFAPLELDYGQACIFRGGELSHGTVDNDSGSTRISFDLRFRITQP
jgi:hypothetical protein